MKLRASILAATASLAPSASALTSAPSKPRRGCSKLFTVRMGERAAQAVYRPSRSHVSLRNLRLLGYIERCERNPQAQGFVRAYDRRLGREWKAARAALTATPAGWAIPAYVVMCESHGQNLPPNSAGASGYYQIIPSTWAAYGGAGPAAYLASKGEQDQVAARIWREGGPSQWVCAG